jgi:hypothetical protein
MSKDSRKIEAENRQGKTCSEFDHGVEARRKDLLNRIEYEAPEFYKAITDEHVYGVISMETEDYTDSVHPMALRDQIPAKRLEEDTKR